MSSLAFFDLNPIHVGFVLILALVLFGPKKLPEVGKQLGNALKDLKKAGNDVMGAFHGELDRDDRPAPMPYSEPYNYGYPDPATQTEQYGSASSIAPYRDLTDYTIVGVNEPAPPVVDAEPGPVDDGAVPHPQHEAAATVDLSHQTGGEQPAVPGQEGKL